METKEKVLEILHEIKPTKDLSRCTDIIEGGYIDSFELMNLITMISEKFQVEVGIEEIMPENFNSADSIAAMIGRLKK